MYDKGNRSDTRESAIAKLPYLLYCAQENIHMKTNIKLRKENPKYENNSGINTKNLKDYLTCDKIICCGGSWMVKGDMIQAGEFDKIREMTKEAVELAAKIRG